MRNENPNPNQPCQRDVDQQIRLNQLHFELERLGGRFDAPDGVELDPEIEEAFLRRVLNFENAALTTQYEQLMRQGVVLPPPEEVTDEALPRTLAMLVEELARQHTYLLNTDHLSDRELYAYLWYESLREEVPDVELSAQTSCHIDILGSCSEKDLQLWLKYYASEQDREDWKRDLPNFPMPERETPPFRRDRTLPQPPFPAFGGGGAPAQEQEHEPGG